MKTLLSFIFSLLAVTSFAQVNLSALTDCTEVRRISTVKSTIKRPLLSLNNLDNGNNHQKGYDVEYVLNHLSSMSTTINSIFTDANFSTENPPTDASAIDNYSRVLQYKAFRTLLTYLRSSNGQDGVTVTEINHSLVFDMEQLTNFLTALKQPSSYYLVSENNSSGITDDYVKWAQSLANYARAIDLYLAFEIAVMHEAETNDQPELESQYLLSMAEKETLLVNLALGIRTAYKKLTKDYGFGVNEDDTESGNRPLKMYADLGYSMMAYQFKEGTSNSTTKTNYRNQFIEAINAIDYTKKDNSRSSYWGYQSEGGEQNWAEGPFYFEYAFRELIPYWHALRIAGQVTVGGQDDPFNNPKFLNPFEWLIDISTPDGRIPPIDDSNKRTIKYGKIMSFTSPYETNAQAIRLGSKWRWMSVNAQANNNALLNYFL